ncbi:hypothetical protein [Stenotrophomonas sp. AG209]|uniref:hypothetical protein n=1 Tax=unclassified Stenotrophomonas TaxID=196198 RepID=UPI0015FC6CC6|nr:MULTISPECIES: hypothetical protein [unclassified Stenotrophomonas]
MPLLYRFIDVSLAERECCSLIDVLALDQCEGNNRLSAILAQALLHLAKGE